MKLGLATYTLPPDKAKELEPGVIQLPQQKHSGVRVINTETGEVVDNIQAFIWGPGTGYAGAIEAPGLFEPEHFEEGKDYVLIAFECSGMTVFEGPPT